eukprot:CAMPEP_0176301234 /NCGR_PEP_ID=MMETSP0121_2-20121125/60749_1 /TAXON_ID=160619 /ORGANISM="Kryptoperidinium foliaceum, Strain CCMP 1326" /LENGTH=86 /DNA_ID=CAMNT_0017642681 /DNA_START=37 /DNA_END=297 /DNA_ORIENTATION=+
MSSSIAPKALYRVFLRQAQQMTDYNFRLYSVRRVKAGFRKHQNLHGEEAAAAMKEAESQLQVLQRQVVLGKLYPSARSVMESPSVA